MTDDFRGSLKIYVDEATGSNGGFGLGREESGGTYQNAKAAFYRDVDAAKEEIRNMEDLYVNLDESHKEIMAACRSIAVSDLGARIKGDMQIIIQTSKLINKKLNGLVLSRATLRMIPGSGPGSDEDKACGVAMNELGELIRHIMRKFQGLRAQMETEQKHLIHKRFAHPFN